MSERDPALDKAWRAHSREEPPPALDQAILAAAHRAVASAPRKVVPEATRPPRWWMPLAAAATIGVVAIGLVQLAPPEPPTLDMTSASPPAQRILEEKTRAATAPATNEPADALKDSDLLKKQKSAADSPAPASAPRADANTKALVPKVVAPAPPAAPAEARSNKRDAPQPEPFPAATPGRKAESADDKRASGGVLDRGKFAEDAVAPAARPAPPPMASAERESGARREFQKKEAQVAATTAPLLAPAAPAPVQEAAPEPQKLAAEKDAASAPASSAGRLRAQVEQKPAVAGTGAMSQLAKNPDATNEARQRARDPDAWIVRIRKLRDDGNTAEALRELREFRATVPDPERRLPPDLRDWKP